ncbi:CBS domain-containing protein [Azospirillum agricola]|uniref:CBS domain-containing protein n=1 Tax=Azospirillum agricola TaxID=1720247 RepID=UPI000A0F1F3D|nr:CBS domain-containing protein [Azospirillum agricola]SMH60754.1 CBS domain-containing protein [Azospirillum lipoferum]
MNRTIGDLVRNHRIVALPPQASVRDAARHMKAEHVASIVVTGADACAAGIFTERDLTDRVVADGLDPDATPLSAVMTPCPVTTSPGTTVGDALRCMATNALRHLPVVEQGRVVGIVSMRDFVGEELAVLDREKAVMDHLTETL